MEPHSLSKGEAAQRWRDHGICSIFFALVIGAILLITGLVRVGEDLSRMLIWIFIVGSLGVVILNVLALFAFWKAGELE